MTKEKRILICTVGLPRSGKSTWSESQGVPVVNPDSIRLELHGQAFYGPAEPMVWYFTRVMIGSLFRSGHKFVILDSTGINSYRRKEWMSDQWETYFKLIPTDKDVCISRCEDLNDYLIPVIERMAKQWEDLKPHEKQLPDNWFKEL